MAQSVARRVRDEKESGVAEGRTGWGEERSLTVRWNDPTTATFDGEPMSGIDQARALLNGDLPAAPVAQLLGMRMTDVSPGSATFTLEPHQSHENGGGAVNGGVLATLLDMAVACAVMTTLPAGHGFTSIDLTVSMLRAAGADSGTLSLRRHRRQARPPGGLHGGQGDRLEGTPDRDRDEFPAHSLAGRLTEARTCPSRSPPVRMTTRPGRRSANRICCRVGCSRRGFGE